MNLAKEMFRIQIKETKRNYYNLNTQYPTIDPATLAAFKGFNPYAANIAPTEKRGIEYQPGCKMKMK